MHQISLEAIDKAYPETVVLEGASLSILAGQRIGLIGQNGSGKSTLLGIIGGSVEPDGGEIVRASGLRVASLAQDPTFPTGSTVEDAVSFSREAISLADRLGLKEPTKLVAELSGGQRKRLALAVALATDCDLLILDEPTNHLDVDTIDWLEDYIEGLTSTLLLITHDRYLLDRVVDTIVEVYDHKLYPHRGTYGQYLEARAAREAIENANTKRLKQRIKTELAWLRKSPKARTSKSRQRTTRATEIVDAGLPRQRPELVMTFPPRRIGSKVVNLHNVGKTYGDHVVLQGITHLLPPDARIGIVGPNGAGKTTLLALMAQRIEPDTGKVVVGSTIVPGWYGQDPTPIPPETRLIDAVRDHADEVQITDRKTATAAKLLEMFQFTHEQQQSTVGDLSGGERRRLELLFVLMGTPNLLLLDEPTNDLDLDTLHALEDYLDGWQGAMVVASHDRYFLDRVCRDIFSIQPDGSVQHHPGGWSAYWTDRQNLNDAPTDRTTATKTRPKAPRTKLTFNDQRELKQLTAQIPRLEAERSRLEHDLAGAGTDIDEVSRLGAELATTITTLDAAETRWLELTELAEKLSDDR
ncbi:MAG: ABC-F family ATP-binding cassette domain-containing protein [Acidimicrobiia bacterium]|nr:ABC-F family ATP-binding cassette domain-containing protein [Acidimicrobiia bacterium]